ncbi:UNVERIFIED_ORG: NAD(P)-dependent dehydrogenase (short-subunit alcohol dehydrogenase family) [Paraburkholderia sediminicola]|jgi:NAD(P)-dependent dehydrogenase (short-subunit alcohol dehydrogenase family)|uniref:NADP-dependent 3-hydroxy acid dehydrogenase YdfG n=1 Tax=Paraburkholderia aspalathi TaxID=1324617 RepID=A0A1I7E454_9BURK|nr:MULTISPECIES: oxidoreductase [Paraburkholderia]MCP2089028.1 NAD(P)-dependent dehydrogenase (short-subunit alcohol dehydrogenase family) [Paraburkholderia sediminicola]MBK3837160.1 SDR family NAD(P)-dependent oxidoreductase [Paraburkholderia aspalathi]MCX4136918.1 oxidoreductase [Paraburkholderia aspalathi]MDN7169610.1 oxidoreductase [Paraburkholderia sp. SEWSISQ10-3 4]MDQ6499249.1 oxidoreductase [Paraburkholderia aspalathi]
MANNTNNGFKRVWFITGATRGLGALIAEAALADGNAVVATGRNIAAITERFGHSAALLPVALDVTDEAQAKAAVQAAVERFGRIDVLVNNAGFGLLGAIEESSDADVRRMYDTNVFGLLNITRAVLPVMRAQRAGHVINMSSIGGYRAAAGFGAYSSTKFAVEGLTEALRAELKPLGIHATVVEPGYFRTDFLDATSLVVAGNVIADYDETSGEVRRRATHMNHNQPGNPEKLAAAMVELVDAQTPPLRLPLGTDTLKAIAEKNAYVTQETETWKALSASTDFSE